MAGSDDVVSKVSELLGSPEWVDAIATPRKGGDNKPSVPGKYKLCGDLLQEKGFDPCKVVDWQVLKKLGKLPNHTDSQHITDIRELDAKTYVFFVSHQWVTGESVDDEHNTKAKSLVNFAEWYINYYKGKPHLKLYFWMDIYSLDQTRLDAVIPALPLYVSSCSALIEYFTSSDTSYGADNHWYGRAWCRLEAIIAYKYLIAGAAPYVVPEGFDFKRDSTVQGGSALQAYAKRYVDEPRGRKLLDPSNGDVYKPEDKNKIEQVLKIVDTVRLPKPIKGRAQANVNWRNADIEARVLRLTPKS